MVRAQPAQRAEDDDAAGSMAEGGAHGKLGVGGILVARPSLDAHAAGPQRRQAVLGDRVEIADQLVDREPQLRGVRGRRRPPRRPGGGHRPSQARRCRSPPARDGATGDHDGDIEDVGGHAAALAAGGSVSDTVGLRMLTGRRSRVDSLRWYEPDQVPRVCGRAALSAPFGAPLSHLRAGLRCYTRPEALTTVGTVSATQCAPALRNRPRSAAPVRTPMAVASARRAMAMSSMASPTRTSVLGFSRR